MAQMLKSSTMFSLRAHRKINLAASGMVLLAAGALADSTVTSIEADVWADNWFALYTEGALIKEDSVSITTERSFNAESFSFNAQLPVVLSFVVKDFKQDDTGLEYIGSRRQQMGDGGFIAQFTDATTGRSLLVTDNQWKCLPIHIAPLDKSCEKSSDPSSDCTSSVTAEPSNWQATDFDDASWPQAVQHSEQTVSPKDGYDRISWHNDAKLIWTADLEADNTLLCRVTLE
jgi:hypothetical protein